MLVIVLKMTKMSVVFHLHVDVMYESFAVRDELLSLLCNCMLLLNLFTASTTVPPLKQKGKVPVQDTKIPESPKLGRTFTSMPKEKEPEPEVIKLKKVPEKPPEPEKQVLMQKAEVTSHHDPELTIHGLHDREDREIITLGRTERIFTAEDELIQLGQFEEAERVVVVQETEKEGWIRTLKPHKVEEPEVSSVDKKKITKLPKADEQKESIKLKPFGKHEKPEEELQRIKLKKVPTKPKEAEKEVITHKVESMRHYDTELTVQTLHDRENHELITLGRTERVFTADEHTSVLGYQVEPKKLESENEKPRWIRTPKALNNDEPDLDLTKKKIKKLPEKEEEQEVVTLKPFKKPQNPEAPDSPKTKKEEGAQTDTAYMPFKRGEMLQRDQPTSAIKCRKNDDTPLTTPQITPDVNKDQKEIPQKKDVGLVPKNEKSTSADKLHGTPKKIDKEQVVLKPFTKVVMPQEKPEKEVEEEKKKLVEAKKPSRDETPKELREQQIRQVEKSETPKKEAEKLQEKEEGTVLTRKPSIPGKKEVIPHEEAGKEILQKQTQVPKKGTEIKKAPPRAGKDKTEEEPHKPTEQLKKVELQKTPPTKIKKTKPKEDEVIPTQKKASPEKARGIPKTVFPKDYVEAVEEVSEPEKPGKIRIPMTKEVSPGAVQMKKVPTQPEEEVLEVKAEEVESEEEEEAWGWELVPPEDWEGEGVDGALETPGMPGGKRGEPKASDLSHLMSLETCHPI